MVVSNGTTRDPDAPIADLGELLPETAPVKISGRTLWAWVVSNKRYPRLVQANLDVARRKLAAAAIPRSTVPVPRGDPLVLLDKAEAEGGSVDGEVLEAYRLAVRQMLARFGIATLNDDRDSRLLVELEGIQPPPDADAEDPEVAWDKFISRCLLTVIPDGLTSSEADMVDRDVAVKLLEDLGVVDRNPALAAAKIQEAGETSADPQSIGATPPPDSGASTAEPIQSAS